MQPCGATMKPIEPMGWVCDGTNLLVITDDSGEPFVVLGVPVAVRADLVDRVDAKTRQAFTGFVPFAGGDHVHLMVNDDA